MRPTATMTFTADAERRKALHRIADKHGLSTSQFINIAIDETIEALNNMTLPEALLWLNARYVPRRGKGRLAR